VRSLYGYAMEVPASTQSGIVTVTGSSLLPGGG
jgi:hypothetical protein